MLHLTFVLRPGGLRLLQMKTEEIVLCICHLYLNQGTQGEELLNPVLHTFKQEMKKVLQQVSRAAAKRNQL